MTNQEVMLELVKDTPLNRARQQLSNWRGKIDTACRQRNPITPVQMRRMEFEAVIAIVDAFNGI